MKTRIYVPDIACDSCVKLIRKKLGKMRGVMHLRFEEDAVLVEHTDKITVQEIIKTIQDLQFRAATTLFERKTFMERIRHFKEKPEIYKIEKQIFTNALWIFLILFILEGAMYLFTLKDIPQFIERYGIWILYLNISIATISMAVWHFFTYRVKITCMLGMMIGMTFGMQTGMMIGAILGATNGFFVGAMAGMVLGTAIGAITGMCCGVMGIMEGLMAGLMGGTMGPMISVMMLTDNIHYFMPFYMLVNVIIVWGLSYMLYEEAVEGKKGVIAEPIDFMTICTGAIIVTFVLLMIMLFGPKALLTV